MWVKTPSGRLVNLDNIVDLDSEQSWSRDTNRRVISAYSRGHCLTLAEGLTPEAAEAIMADIEHGLLVGAVLVDLAKRETHNAQTPKSEIPDGVLP